MGFEVLKYIGICKIQDNTDILISIISALKVLSLEILIKMYKVKDYLIIDTYLLLGNFNIIMFDS